jgi:hypothetical protein
MLAMILPRHQHDPDIATGARNVISQLHLLASRRTLIADKH